MNNRLLVQPIPVGVKTDDCCLMQVRCQGDEAWTDVPLYAVNVDMHDVRQAAAAIFDFEGQVEIRVQPKVSWIHSAVIRPVSKGIVPENTGRELRFTLDRPENLMIEINGERFHCLHIFAGEIQEEPTENVLRLDASRPVPHTVETRRLLPRLATMPEGATLVLGPGLHVIDEYLFPVPSGLRIHLAAGAVVIGGFVVQSAENVRIDGHGVILQESFHRYSSINGIRVSHSRHVSIEGVNIFNPAHYTVYLGGSEDVTIRNIHAFSCEGWSDGIDMMSCRRVHVEGCFLRNSDDCITIYGRRWEYNGNAEDILVENCSLWADVAHPTTIGGHGDYEHEGNIIQRITIRNIDILEHHEFQPGYLGCLAINVGDKNIVRDVLYEDIRVENITHGKLIDFRVMFNEKYNPAPGGGIENVVVRRVRCDCLPQVDSVVEGYDEERCVRHVRLEDVTVCGQPLQVKTNQYAWDVTCAVMES